ncbi:HlyD family secretion protein [Alloalcanivorax gelatiniphagus]|uniref:HlyD family secretion protein n=1 Tax=Alloalcanivorax gelatiniphagus TaxID=1194167 RepID=A0ABY2XNU5_9GAMM|nr:HlyD family secretion protein [Alloalcanivorax gelatiniphagus]TMW14136.1 HlyD family secretion protein [Alloalcanivorax gelatiniphagus]|tara:strand:+ start:8363 stop:9247 length:885 start_codon:yes stop_codon:yes gene_type:complete
MSEAPLSERRPGRWRPLLLTGGLVLVAAIAVWFLWFQYVHQLWTRDARVRAAVIQVAPDVSGRITKMAVTDNSRVEEGEALFSVDPERYRLAVTRAEAERAHRRQELALRDDEASRRKRLGRAVSSEERESATRLAEVARADLHAAEAALKEAQLDLQRANVPAPVGGFVTHLLAQAGDYARAGEPVLALVDGQSFWIEAYFRETQVHRLSTGDRARVRLLGSDRILDGKVAGIARGIANPNAASGTDQGLPPVSPTFEWVRLAQRIPVRIELDRVPEDLTLVAGMTASVSIGE